MPGAEAISTQTSVGHAVSVQSQPSVHFGATVGTSNEVPRSGAAVLAFPSLLPFLPPFFPPCIFSIASVLRSDRFFLVGRWVVSRCARFVWCRCHTAPAPATNNAPVSRRTHASKHSAHPSGSTAGGGGGTSGAGAGSGAAPPNQRTIVVFVVGGVTPAELRCVDELRASLPGVSVVVGGTTIMSPSRFINDLRYGRLQCWAVYDNRPCYRTVFDVRLRALFALSLSDIYRVTSGQRLPRRVL